MFIFRNLRSFVLHVCEITINIFFLHAVYCKQFENFWDIVYKQLVLKLFLAERRKPSSSKAHIKFLVSCIVSCFAKMKINMCFKLLP